MYKAVFKRLLDIVISLIVLTVLFPILILVAILVRIRLGSPILFTQQRPGKDGQIFTIIKFRTMTNAYNKMGKLLSDEERLTTFGSFLRKSSLDELPELFNVLRGEMSLVGPRPLLVQYLEHYSPEQARRHEVRPGITGWAQVNGRNAITWEKKFELDVWYVDNLSLWLDLKILVMTITKVVRREGISQEGHATASYFQGSNGDDVSE